MLTPLGQIRRWASPTFLEAQFCPARLADCSAKFGFGGLPPRPFAVSLINVNNVCRARENWLANPLLALTPPERWG